MLGQERVKAGLVRRRVHRRLVAEALELLEHPEIRREAIAGTLSVAAQQLVEVARALVSNARVIVFDEPTSSLTERDAERLFAVIERMRARGLAIVYISHFLEEVRRISGRYTVLRDGANGGLGADGRDDTGDDHRGDGRPRPDRHVPARAAHAGRTGARAERTGAEDRPQVRRRCGPPGRDPGHRRPGRRGPHRAAPRDLRARPGALGHDRGQGDQRQPLAAPGGGSRRDSGS